MSGNEQETPKKKRLRTRVLLVEDQRLVQQFLEDIVNNSEQYELAASLRNADLADVYCEREQIDLILKS